MIKKSSICFFVIFSLLLTFWEFRQRRKSSIVIQEESGEKTVIKMSFRDAKHLEAFFLELVLRDCWGYTLSGNKPLSWSCYEKPFSSFSFFLPPNIKLYQGWKTWQKYQDLFANSRFKMWVETSNESNLCTIILVDKCCFTQVVEQNLQEFQEILPNISADGLLQEAKERPLIKDLLKNHDVLLGILLGYGTNNAQKFHQREKISSVWEPEIERPITEQYIRKFWSWNKFDTSDTCLPFFVGDRNSEESIALKKKYLSTREEIIRYYKGKNFLEATLSLYKNGPSLLQKQGFIPQGNCKKNHRLQSSQRL